MRKLSTGIVSAAIVVAVLAPGVASATPDDGLDSDPGVRKNLVGSSSLYPPVNPLPANIKKRSNAESKLAAPINPLPYSEPAKDANEDRVQREGDELDNQAKKKSKQGSTRSSKSGR